MQLRTGRESERRESHVVIAWCHLCRHEGSTELAVEVEISPDSQPSMWQTDKKLEALIGLKFAPRTAIVQGLWTYIKVHSLLVRPALSFQCWNPG